MLCPKFPATCGPLFYNNPNDIQPTLNVPYCQRYSYKYVFSSNRKINSSHLRYFNEDFFCSLTTITLRFHRNNISVCRIACQAENPLLEFDFAGCLGTPGCAFDYELYLYRSVLSQAILPGVPVCHLAIRNRAFQTRAAEYVQQVCTKLELIKVSS